MEFDIYMQRCLDLALLGQGKVSPNPMVGCVIVSDQGLIISEGYHQIYGGPHAEVMAIEAIEDKSVLKNCTLFVSLEPCNHYGKTPPCSQLIISMGIPKVVVAMLDPNPLVQGNGIKALQLAGINVTVGILEKAARWLNRTFCCEQEKKRPFYILKWAQTANSKMGNSSYLSPESRRISGDESQILSHKWRTEVDAILVGANTVRIDKPQLDSRFWPGKNPTVIVLDKRLDTREKEYQFNKDVNVLVFNEVESKINNAIEYVKIDFNQWQKELCSELLMRKIQSVLVEGGAKILNYFIQAGLWDECRVFASQETKNWSIDAPTIPGVIKEKLTIGSDSLTITTPQI